MRTAVLAGVFAAVQQADAWGWQGHAATADMAQSLMDADTVAATLQQLGNVPNISSIASWADEIRDDPGWQWSFYLHFVDVKTGSCYFDYGRDCKGPNGEPDHCVVGAISNYTRRALMQDPQDWESWRFIVHFMGDIHQPLHIGWAGDKGGNTINVSADFNNHPKDELHAVWDTDIIEHREALLKTDYTGYSQALQPLLQKNTAAWGQCIATALMPTDKRCGGTEDGPPPAKGQNPHCLRECLEIIAQEGIQFACKDAYRNVRGDLIKSGDALSEEYYETRKEVVDLRLAQSGARMAKLLEVMHAHLKERKTVISEVVV